MRPSSRCRQCGGTAPGKAIYCGWCYDIRKQHAASHVLDGHFAAYPVESCPHCEDALASSALSRWIERGAPART